MNNQKILMRYLLILLSLFTITSCTDSTVESSDLVEAIPITSPVIIRINDIQEASTNWDNSLVANTVDTLNAFYEFFTQAHALKQWFSKAPKILDQPIWIASQKSGAHEYSWLWVLRDVEKASLLSKISEKTLVRNYSGVDIFEFSLNENKWYASSLKQVIISSSTHSLIEEGIRQLQSEFSLEKNQFFNKVKKTANTKDPFNVFIQNEKLPELILSVFPGTKPDWLSSTSIWAGIDASIESNQMVLNGVVLHPDTCGGYLSVFKNLGKGEFEAPAVLPNHIAMWIGLHIDNGEDFYSERLEFLKKGKAFRSQQIRLGDLGINPLVDIYPLVDNEIGVFYLQNVSTDLSATKVGYIKCNDEDDRAELRKFLTNNKVYETYRDHILYSSAYNQLFQEAFGRLFKGFNKPYITEKGNYLIFADNDLVLKNVINEISAEKTLNQNENFIEFYKQYPSAGHLFAMVKNPEAISLLDKITTRETAAEIAKKTKKLEKVTWAGIHILNKGEVSYLQSTIKYQEEQIEEARQLWSLTLEAPMKGKPHLIKNHYTQKNEVFVQDENNVIYLIDGKGKILWNKSIGEPILGGVHQVDLFKNNKLQLVFNTPSKLWMLDRLGRDVENFPVTLKAQSTAPVSVFDYDKTRNYRFVVPTGNQLYNYNKDGEMVKGWVFEGMNSDIKHSPEHFAVNGKDFILVTSSGGAVKFINRRGELRTDIDGKIPLSDNPWFFVNKDSQPRVVTLSEKATLVSVFLTGSIDETDLGFDETEKITFSYNGHSYVFLEGPHLNVRDELHPFTAQLDGTPIAGPYSFSIHGKNLYGVTTKNPDRVYVYNEEGEMVDGFPVFGNTGIELGPLENRSIPVLLVGTGDGTLMAYSIR